MPLACFDANSNVSTHRKHTTRTFPLVWFNLHVNLKQFPFKKSCYHQGFFAVKRRAVFILGAKWKALVRGWRRDCVVGGMETRFQWRKAHSRTAKCEAFHFAPRLFFMFLFFIPLTIRQQCLIYPQKFSTDPKSLFSTFLVIWERIKPYKVGKCLIGFHLQLLYIRYLMTTW